MKLKTAPTMPTTVSTSSNVPANWFLDSLTRYRSDEQNDALVLNCPQNYDPAVFSFSLRRLALMSKLLATLHVTRHFSTFVTIS